MRQDRHKNSDLLSELSECAPIGVEIAILVGRLGTPTRVISGHRVKSLIPLDHKGEKLFEVDEVYVWELEDRNAIIDALTFRDQVQSYQISRLRPEMDVSPTGEDGE